ncbi:DsbA family protein [Shewanella sp. UCD-KL12]|uniref:DsbA family protein n=1 Tax=Shewanella sp. UCD-KL12 TaxID=1917163 RepID=UPI000971194C|nr:DsbA family protein [Shewanella sp. UCD-KL12]
MALKDKAQLYYVYDPMCSWCWGYNPTWTRLKSELSRLEIKLEYRLGGLAPDSSEIMPEEMQLFLKQTWHKIHALLGTQFNHDFWAQCQPRRSTYPACRAALIARDEGLEQQMLKGIQTAYYLKAENPSDLETLTNVAKNIGIDSAHFVKQMNCHQVNQRLLNEINSVQQLPINGLPSLVLHLNDELIPIALDYHDWQTSYDAIAQLLLQPSR